MRTNLFLSTLFAVSLIGGAALAQKPGFEAPARAPRAIEAFRSHGDTVDKSYRTNDPTSRQSRAGDASTSSARTSQRPSTLNQRSSSRINCSDTGADCGGSSRSNAKPAAHGPAAGAATQQAKTPMAGPGNERMNCNEADECSVSSKGAQKTWAASNGGKGANSPTDKPGGAVRSLDERTRMQPSDSRMSCNEADECMASSKDSKKVWALESVKAGTFHGGADAAAQQDTEQKARAKKEQARQTQERTVREKSSQDPTAAH